MNYVTCRTLFNQTKLVPAESLIQRPSVYGVVLNGSQILLALARSTQNTCCPVAASSAASQSKRR